MWKNHEKPVFFLWENDLQMVFVSSTSMFTGGYLVANYPRSKWVITPVINGISRVSPLIIGVITHLLSGMSHQVCKGTKDDIRSTS